MSTTNERSAPAYVREADAAKLLCLAAGTLQNWRALGEGPPYLKLGGRVVYAQADLIAWAEGQRRGDASAADRKPRPPSGREAA